MAETNAAVIVDFVDLAPGYFNPVVVTVVPLPPALAAGGAITEAVVRPGFQNFSNHVLAVIKSERDRDFNIAAGGDLYLPTEEKFRHGIRCPSRIMLPVVRLYVNDGVIYVTHPPSAGSLAAHFPGEWWEYNTGRYYRRIGIASAS
jgi:hypothetical protein